MFSSRTALAAIILGALAVAPAAAACPDPAGALGVARVVEIDTSGGPIFGALTARVHEARFLAPKEVVLTFDDGPLPRVTDSILETLDRYCTKATFFSVGRMAVAYPEMTREILSRGHTLGTHTWSHPILTHMTLDRAREQIDSGFAAVALAAGGPVAPFFRFPGLNDSPALLAHLQQRGIAAFTVDVVSNDSYISDPNRLINYTLQQVEARNGGILLFHDIKSATARALPTILRKLKADGFSVVHLRAKTPYVPDEAYIAAVQDRVQRTRGRRAPLLAVTDALTASAEPAPAPGAIAEGGPPVTLLAPAPRDRPTTIRASVDTVAPDAPRHRPSPIMRQTTAVEGARDTPDKSWTARLQQRLRDAGG
jgi:peptidoglycan/xylan/chitin deacetylase (PgdA/CDA1 family)